MTKQTAPDIPVAVESLLDTPMNGQVPRNWASMMLLTKIAETMISKYSITRYSFLRNLLNRTIR